MKTEVEKILLNVINDFNSKWKSHDEKDTGVSEYAEKIVNLFDVSSSLPPLRKCEDCGTEYRSHERCPECFSMG